MPHHYMMHNLDGRQMINTYMIDKVKKSFSMIPLGWGGAKSGTIPVSVKHLSVDHLTVLQKYFIFLDTVVPR